MSDIITKLNETEVIKFNWKYYFILVFLQYLLLNYAHWTKTTPKKKSRKNLHLSKKWSKTIFLMHIFQIGFILSHWLCL